MLTLSTTILTLYPSATHYVLCRVLSLRSPSLSSPARAYIFVFSDVLWASISLSLDIIKHSAVCFSRVIIKRSHFTPPPPRFEHGSPHYSDVPITDNKQTLHLLVTKAINTFPLGSIWHFQYTDDAWSLSSILLGWKKKRLHYIPHLELQSLQQPVWISKGPVGMGVGVCVCNMS